jgi:alpha-L-rhamnosidase
MKKVAGFLLLMLALDSSAQFPGSGSRDQWDAEWVAVPGAGENTPGLYLFRKAITLESAPEKFEVRVSADNRYKLYINGTLVSLGPALGDIEHWNYETVDLAPYLKRGENIVAAKVWNEGDLKPVSQFSYRTGFILQGTDEATKVLNTNTSWRCIRDMSYTPLRQHVRGYYAAGAGEKIDMKKQVKGWEQLSFDDNAWDQAKPVFERRQRGFGFRSMGSWTLVSSLLPPMELKYQRLSALRKAEGISVPSPFPAEKTEVQIPANTSAKLLLDQSYLTNAYPTLIFSGGKNSTIVITYAEGLYDDEGAKNNRNEIEGKTISGRQDTIISDGSELQDFTSLSWRTYRYIELHVETAETPLVINDFFGTFTGYPFEFNARIESDIAEIDKMMEIGWRTARSCAVETYMDCPYYERLQYIGDARIQLFVSYYNSGDDRLAKNALNLMDYSRQADGYTLSRYPDTQNQVIPTYSLWYVSMLYDYLMYGTDSSFLDDKLLGARQILNYFISYQDTDGSLKNVPGWNFTDWVPDWRMGTGPVGEDGSSALMDLQLLLALQSAVILEQNVGSEEFAHLYQNLAEKLAASIQEKYWDDSHQLYADTPGKDHFSQHTNSLAILAGLAEGQEASEIGRSMLADTTLAPASIYFKYYLHLALKEAGLGDGYLSWLDIWRKNIELGMTTWGEDSEVETTRSDCHAWGASPNIEFFRILLGIESAAPLFEKVHIEPHLGSIEKISGEIPHPEGRISVSYDRSDGAFKAEIILPDHITGTFNWEGQAYELKGGRNTIRL